MTKNLPDSVYRQWADVEAGDFSVLPELKRFYKRRGALDEYRDILESCHIYRLYRSVECRENFCEFVKEAWNWLFPYELTWSWHIEALCRHLELVARTYLYREYGEDPLDHMGPLTPIKDFLACVPPRQTKSLTVSVFFPAWFWLHCPSFRWLCASATDTVALRDARLCRDLTQMPQYDAMKTTPWSWRKDNLAVGDYRNTAGGARLSRIAGTKIVGADADGSLIDDPVDPNDAVKTKKVSEINEWYDISWSQRKTSPNAFQILIMQRVHEMDLAGIFLERGVPALICPAIFEGEQLSTLPTGFQDPRTEEGELLTPRLSRKDLDEKESRMGRRQFVAQYQQKPAPEEGIVFTKKGIRYYQEIPKFKYKIVAADTTIKGGARNDYFVAHAWGVTAENNRYLLESVRKKIAWTEQRKLIKQLAYRHKDGLREILIEAKASGTEISRQLRADSSFPVPIREYNPQGETKESRAESISTLWEEGYIYIPDPSIHKKFGLMVSEYLREMLTFPVSSYDDQVDTTSMANIRINQIASNNFIFESLPEVKL